MSIAEPVSVPSHWDWLGPIYYAVRILVVFLLVGLLSFAAVRTLRLDCREGETFLTSEIGALLTDGQGRLIDPFWGVRRYDKGLYVSAEISSELLRYKGFVPSVGAFCDNERSNIEFFTQNNCGFLTNLRTVY